MCLTGDVDAPECELFFQHRRKRQVDKQRGGDGKADPGEMQESERRCDSTETGVELEARTHNSRQGPAARLASQATKHPSHYHLIFLISARISVQRPDLQPRGLKRNHGVGGRAVIRTNPRSASSRHSSRSSAGTSRYSTLPSSQPGENLAPWMCRIDGRLPGSSNPWLGLNVARVKDVNGQQSTESEGRRLRRSSSVRRTQHPSPPPVGKECKALQASSPGEQVVERRGGRGRRRRRSIGKRQRRRERRDGGREGERGFGDGDHLPFRPNPRPHR